MADPDAPQGGGDIKTPPTHPPKVDPQKALEEQRKRELPSNDWPGKGAA